MTKQKDSKIEFQLFKILKKWFQKSITSPNDDSSVREVIEGLIEEHGDDTTLLETEEKNLLSNILSLKDQTVFDVMVPRADISALDVNASINDLIGIINSEAHSRIPIFQKTLDDVIGMIHIKDVMAAHSSSIGKNTKNNVGKLDLRTMLRDVLFVAPSMKVLELLLEMRAKRTHMALVVDEFGGVDGLLTIEDLVEEIVGEIEDEHDQEENPQMMLNSNGSIKADARVLIGELEELVGPVFTVEEREEFDTLGGLVFSIAGRVPIRGELVKHNCGMEIEILDADPRRIKTILIRGVGTRLLSNDD